MSATLSRGHLERLLDASEAAVSALVAWAAGGCPGAGRPELPAGGASGRRALLNRHSAHVVLARLEALEPGLLPLIGCQGLGALQAVLLPELFGEREPSGPPLACYAGWRRCDELSERAGRREPLARDGDADAGREDGVGLLPPLVGPNGRYCARTVHDRPGPDPVPVLLKGQR